MNELSAEDMAGAAPETSQPAPVESAAAAPAPSPAPVEDNRNDELKALTSHLQNVHLASPSLFETVEQDTDGVEIEQAVLPDDPRELHDLLREVDRTPARTPTDTKIKKAKLARLAEKIHKLAQSPKPPYLGKSAIAMLTPKVDHAPRGAALDALARQYPVVAEVLAELAGEQH